MNWMIRTRMFVGGILMAMPLMAGAQTVELTPQVVTTADLQLQINEIKNILEVLTKHVQALSTRNNWALSTVNISTDLMAVPDSVMAGAKAATIGAIHIDAVTSSEDVAFSGFLLELAAPADRSQRGLSSCGLWDGVRALNVPPRAVNPVPSYSDTIPVAFIFNSELTITKGTSKTLILGCDIINNPPAVASYAWGLSSMPTVLQGVQSRKFSMPVVGARQGKNVNLPK